MIRSSVLACALGLLVVATGGCGKSKPKAAVSVSYTHLTLPTKRIV